MPEIVLKHRNAGASGPPAVLLSGEMAYNALDNILYIGKGVPDLLGRAPEKVAVGGSGAFAKTDSPAFTGAPTAPTPIAGNNSALLATTAFVAAAIASLINSAPGALDTLDELAAALGDDAGFAASLTTSLALKAPLASPNLTGTPTAPTPLTADDSTKIVTSAWVRLVLTAFATLASPSFTGVPVAPTAADGTNTAQLATAAFVQSAIAPKAPLASPALTGNPTAPNQAANDNSTKLANTAYVATAIANLVASSPAALDTLNELAAALGNDANFATTVANSLALKAPLASPTFTGVPVAPTPTVGDNTTKLSTTAFVKASIDALINSAPSTLDTLAEIATAIGNDPAYSTTVATALALKAPLASPTFTGVPVAPTPTAGDSTTKLATTSFVATAVANLVASSPAALDTLNELAAALGNDANFSATITAALALKAPLASPTFTGTPVAPTAAPGDNTTKLATTAFVAAVAALLAPLASPTFTGTPVAPTAADGTNTTQLATTAFVQSGLAPKAPLASPIFTGTPAAPTPTGGDNTTKLATTAFVKAAIDALVATAPSTLDTLNELAAALGSDPNFATTMTTALAAKAPLASPTFTGAPLAPTPTGGDNTTKISTTAFVKTAIDAVINGAPAGLDTLDELAAAIGDDASFSATITTSLALKAPLASPTFTGVPVAPTPTGGDNTTKIATTAFVQNAVATGGGAIGIDGGTF